MSQKSSQHSPKDKSAQAAEVAQREHHDDLIVTPRGASRWRFLLTLALILFILVIFVVADLFQFVVGGGGARADRVWMTWVDPVSGESHEVTELAFDKTHQFLGRMQFVGLYQPDSAVFGERDPRRQRVDVSEDDVASFLVYEDLARDAGVAVGDQEHKDILKAVFQDHTGLLTVANRLSLTVVTLEDEVRRVRRVSKFKELIGAAASLTDPEELVAKWREQHPEYKFQYVQLAGEEFRDEAKQEQPEDADLLAWFHERPVFEQQELYTDEKVVPVVAWLPIEDPEFDASALLAAYPAPEGADLEQQARSYYNQVASIRFRYVEPEDDGTGDDGTGEDGTGEDGTGEDGGSEDGGGGTPPDDTNAGGDGDGDAASALQDTGDPAAGGDQGASDEQVADEQTADEQAGGEQAGGEQAGGERAADEQVGDEQAGDADEGAPQEGGSEDDPVPAPPPAPPKFYFDFEEVEEEARREAPIHAALGAFLQEMKDAVEAGEEIDLAARARELGLRVHAPGEGMTRAEIEAVEGWGGPFVAGQLSLGQAETLLPRVVVEEDAMVVARVAEKTPREEPPFEEIRDEVLSRWVEARGAEIAVERLESLRDEMATRPEDDGSGDDETQVDDEGEKVDPGANDWVPVVAEEDFRRVCTEAGHEVVDRPWLERFELPGDDFDAATEGDQFIRSSAHLFQLEEEGQVPKAEANRLQTHAFLVRFGGERPAELSELTAGELATLRDQESRAAVRELGSRVFLGDSPWLIQRFQLRFPVLEAREAEEAAAADGDGDGAASG